MMKHSILSSILFAALLLGCNKEAKQNNVAERTIKIQTGTLQEHTFREIFRAQGMVEAARKGTISAYVPGRIDKIYFEEGTIAEPGKSLFQIDQENYNIQLEIARKDSEVMKSARLSAQENVKLDQIKLEKAELDFNRAKTLYQSKAISTDAYEQAETNYNGTKVSLDGAVAIDNAAAAKVQQSEMVNEGAMDFVMVLITAVFLTFLVIAAIMESLSRPFLVMFTIPLGFVGFFAMLYFTGTLLSMVGMLGGIMMIGIVVNNAILIMDETSTLHAAGVKMHDAMLQASQKKFRPILMTSIASVIGMLPMAFGRGIGYEIRSSCGIGVVGGLLFAMFLTLYFIPAAFYMSHKNK